MPRWLLLILLAACGADDTPTGDRVLVYTRTAGFRHAEAIDAALDVLPDRLAREGLIVDATEDPAKFTEENLLRYRAVIFLYTTGNDILDATGKTSLERFVRRGGGWFGVHSAADTEYVWPFYKSLVITHLVDHPDEQQATVMVTAPSHTVMTGVPVAWVATDEWYNFAKNPRGELGIDVLATVDESTYTGGTMGVDHPVIWAHERLVSRVLYTSLGHSAARWQEPAFVEHIANGVRWVTGLAL